MEKTHYGDTGHIVARHSVAGSNARLFQRNHLCRVAGQPSARKKTVEQPRGTLSRSMFCAGKYQSDYFPLAAGFFATGALAFTALAAPIFAFGDFVAFVDLAAPVFALVDFGAAAGLATAVFALVDFGAADFAEVLFAAMIIFLREDLRHR